MPIVFPPLKWDSPLRSDVQRLFAKPFDRVPAPNMAAPGLRFDDELKHASVARKKFAAPLGVGPRCVSVQTTAIVNPVTDDVNVNAQGCLKATQRILGALNMVLSGVSKDSTGAALGNCTVMIFRAEDRSFCCETVSDASGNWSVSLMKGGPFFLVEYKTGAPDVAGTSVNTLVPVQV